MTPQAEELMFVPILPDDFKRLESDRDMGAFIKVAKADQRSGIVIVVPHSLKAKGSVMRAVYFHGTNAVAFAATGNGVEKATIQTVRSALRGLPENVPPKEPYVRLRPFNLIADDGELVPAFKIMYSENQNFPIGAETAPIWRRPYSQERSSGPPQMPFG
jgi:hypothetical protein